MSKTRTSDQEIILKLKTSIGRLTQIILMKKNMVFEIIEAGQGISERDRNASSRGSLCKKILTEKHDIKIIGYLAQMGDIVADTIDLDEIDANHFFCPDKSKLVQMEELIERLRSEGILLVRESR